MTLPSFHPSQQPPWIPATPIWRVALLVANLLAVTQTATAQQLPEQSAPKANAPASPPDKPIADLIDDLRSDQFATREEASLKIFRYGYQAVPQLRATRKVSNDAEQSERISRIITSLEQQDLESRIRQFLKGGRTDLENWQEFEPWFGDSPRTRQLFVDLYREHPALVAALGGPPQQLAFGLAKVRRRLMQRGVGTREIPQREDFVALLMPMMDPTFRAGGQHDLYVVSLLQMNPASELRNDPDIGKPFTRLVRNWMLSSDFGIRELVLRTAMQWEMKIGLKIALDTLGQTPPPDLLCRCIQTIARQGTVEHTRLLAKYLPDSTTVFSPRHLGHAGNDVQVGDVAAAAIAYLSSVPVTEIGFAEPAEHKTFGIIFEELVIPTLAAGPAPAESSDNPNEKPNADSPDQEPPPFGPDLRLPQTREDLIRQMQLRETVRKQIRVRALQLVPESPPENAIETLEKS